MNEQEYIDQLIDAGATDEEIAEALVLYRGRQKQPAQLAAPAPSATAEDYVGAVVGGINRGVMQAVSEPLKFAGALQRTAMSAIGYPENAPLPFHDLGVAGKAVQDFTESINPRYENVGDVAGVDVQSVAEGLGQAGAMFATAGAGGAGQALRATELTSGLLPATGRAAQELGRNLLSPTGFLGGTITAVPEWEAAKEAGLSDEEAFETLIKNYFVGQTEAVPITNFLSRFNKITKGAVLERIKNFGAGGLEEFLQEGFQTYLTNQIAKEDYDPSRDPMFQVLESAKVGGVVGLFFPVIGSVMHSAPPATRTKLEQVSAILQANAEIAKATIGDPEVDASIDEQIDETTNAIENLAEPKPLTLTPITLPGNEPGKVKKANQFNISLPGVGTAQGTIVGDKASILEIFAETDEEGNVKKGGGLYKKVIDELRAAGINQVVVGVQSESSTAALKSLTAKGALIPNLDNNETDPHGNPTRFDIVLPGSKTEAELKTASPEPQSPPRERSNPERERIIEKINRGESLSLEEVNILNETESRLPARELVDDFDQTGALLGGSEESKSATKAAASEQLADFLRGKVKSKGEIVDFQDEWNEKHPERQITGAEVQAAWDLIRAPKSQATDTITVPVNEALKEQIQTFYRGVEKGVKKGQKLVNEKLIPKVQQALKAARLTPRQTSAILNKIKTTNLFTPGSQSKLNEFIDKVVKDAEYAEKLAQARSLQKRIKKFGRQKSDSTPLGNKLAAKNFGRVNPSKVSDIDEYLTKAGQVIAAFKPVNSEGYAEFNHQEIGDYAEKHLTDEEDAVVKEIKDSEDTSEEEVRAVARASAERLAEKDLGAFDERGKRAIETMKKIDLSQLDKGFLIRYIKTVDNIVENDDLSNEAFIETTAAAQDFVRKWEDILARKKAKTSEVGLWGRVMNNISNLWKRIYQDQEIETLVREYYQKLAHAGSKREQIFSETEIALDNKLKDLQKKFKTDLRTLENQMDFQVYYLLRQMANEGEMTKMHRNIRATIERHRKAGNEAETKAWEQAYEPFKEVRSADETDAIINKKNPAAQELWQFFRGIFTDQLAAEQSRIAREVYNRDYVPVINYLPIVQHHVNNLYRRVQKMEEKTPDVSPSINPQQARTAMRRSLNLMDQHAVYTSKPLNDLLMRFSETTYDNMAAKEEMKLVALLRSPKLRDLVGGQKNEEAVIKAFDRFLAIQRGLHTRQTDSETAEFFTETAKTFRHIGTIKALASLSQIAKQSTVSVKTWMNLMTTGDADLFVAAAHAVGSIKSSENGPIKKLLDNSTLVARSLRLGGTDRGTSEAYKLQRGARRWFFKKAESFRIKLDKRVRKNLSFLVKPDLFNARTAFIAYYMKSLRDQGLKNDIDLNTEWQKQDTPERQKAIAFAETMIEKTQTASNAALLSDIQAKGEDASWEFIKTVFLPFSTFDADFKARFVNEVSAVRRTKSAEDLVRLGGTVGEALTFSLVSGIGVYWWKELIEKGIYAALGSDEPEKEEEKVKVAGLELSKKGIKQRLVSSSTQALNPLAIGVLPQDLQSKALNQLGYMLREDESQTKKDWMKENALAFEAREGTLADNLGVYSTGVSPLIELMGTDAPRAVMSALGEPVSIVDAYGNEKQVRLTKEEQIVLGLKVLVEGATLAGRTEADIANVVRKIYRDQMREAKAEPSQTESKKKSFKRKRKSFKRDE